MAKTRLTLEQANSAYQERFKVKDYKLISFTTSREPCTLSCPIHGEVVATSYANLMHSHQPCPKCGKAKVEQVTKKVTDDEYLKLFHEVHGDKYTYDMARDEKYRITLFCPEHGASKLLPSHIANQKRGCPKCAAINAGKKRMKST